MNKVKPTPHRDITNERYGSLTALRPTIRKKDGFQVWKVRCDCGKMIRASWKELHDGKITDCETGCWPSKRLQKQIKTVEMWSRINAKRRAKRYEENRVKWAKQKEARKKRREADDPSVDRPEYWGYDNEHEF